MHKKIIDYAKEWQNNAEADALWAILTNSTYYGNKWDVADFFATGEEEISRVFRFMEQQTLNLPSGKFLDFGCGVGRLSKALKRRFGLGVGVDISPKMTELARGYVRDVEFVTNQNDSLAFLEDSSIDFIYSHLVLQHIPNYYQKHYITEFLRMLRPGGLAVFQIFLEIINPCEPIIFKLKRVLKELMPFLIIIKRRLNNPATPHHDIRFEMHPLPNCEIQKICEQHGCVIEAAPATNSCDANHNGNVVFYDAVKQRKLLEESGRPNQYFSCMYFVRKPLPESASDEI